jgi:Flp pilus assembly protein TadG
MKGIRGASLTELALYLPVLLIIIIGTLNISRSVRGYTTASLAAREAGFSAYRSCADLESPRPCLNSIVRAVATNFATRLPGVRIRISVYNLNTLALIARSNAHTIPAGFSFVANLLSPRDPGDNITYSVVAEVYVPNGASLNTPWGRSSYEVIVL